MADMNHHEIADKMSLEWGSGGAEASAQVHATLAIASSLEGIRIHLENMTRIMKDIQSDIRAIRQTIRRP